MRNYNYIFGKSSIGMWTMILMEIVSLLRFVQGKDAEIINIDGELIRLQRKVKKDNDYWIDVKVSKNKKGEIQLMVLAGSKNSRDKAQLFLDPTNERLAYDQNNANPCQIFTKVIGVFKNSISGIQSKN